MGVVQESLPRYRPVLWIDIHKSTEARAGKRKVLEDAETVLPDNRPQIGYVTLGTSETLEPFEDRFPSEPGEGKENHKKKEDGDAASLSTHFTEGEYHTEKYHREAEAGDAAPREAEEYGCGDQERGKPEHDMGVYPPLVEDLDDLFTQR